MVSTGALGRGAAVVSAGRIAGRMTGARIGAPPTARGSVATGARGVGVGAGVGAAPVGPARSRASESARLSPATRALSRSA
jgi:hypothetical protein